MGDHRGPGTTTEVSADTNICNVTLPSTGEWGIGPGRLVSSATEPIAWTTVNAAASTSSRTPMQDPTMACTMCQVPANGWIPYEVGTRDGKPIQAPRCAPRMTIRIVWKVAGIMRRHGPSRAFMGSPGPVNTYELGDADLELVAPPESPAVEAVDHVPSVALVRST